MFLASHTGPMSRRWTRHTDQPGAHDRMVHDQRTGDPSTDRARPDVRLPAMRSVSEAGDLSCAQRCWRDRAWSTVIGNADVVLRRWNGVYEFTDDAECVLRVGLHRASAPVRLTDGVVLAAGSPIGVLHFWNEHLPDIRWAKIVERKIRCSLAALAVHIECAPSWAEVSALRADAALSGRLRGLQMLRIAERYGFEMTMPEMTTLDCLHAFGENFLLWAFARAFNPAALSRHRFLRDRVELWISREALTGRFLQHDSYAAAGTSIAKGP